MRLLMTVVFENGFQEIYLPSVNNKTVPIVIRPHISGWNEDVILPLEVWEDVWQISGGRQFAITVSERMQERVTLTPGLLINCEMRSHADAVFSLTISEVNQGNTRFDKFFLDFPRTGQIGIGSGNGNVITYKNQFCSPKHAVITSDGSQAVVRDLGSVNGTFVGGRALHGEHVLKYGDEVYIIGLKIVYLGNVLAVNNPHGECMVDQKRLTPIHIAPAEDADGQQPQEYGGEEAYFLRTPRKVEKLDHEVFAIEKCAPKSLQKRQPVIYTIGPSITMMVPMLAGVLMMGGQGASAASGIVMTVGAAALGGMWAMLNTQYQKKEEAGTEATRVDTYTQYIAKIAQQIEKRMAHNHSVLGRMLPAAQEVAQFPLVGSARLWEKGSTHEDFLSLRVGTGNILSPNRIEVPKEQLMAQHDPLNDKVEEIQQTMSWLKNVPVDVSAYENRMMGIVSADREKVLNLGNIISAQLAGLYAYNEVRLCYIYPMKEADSWDYARWLPHVWIPDGKLRMLANDKNTVGDVMYHLSGVIRDRLERASAQEEGAKVLPHYVVMIADWSLVEDEPIAKYLMNPQPELGITVIYLVDAVDKLPSGCTAIVQDDADQQGFYSTIGAFDQRENVHYDALNTEQIDRFARSLSNYRVRELNASTAIPDVLTFLDMYKTSRVEDLDMLHKWLENRTYESMKSMVGYKSGNQPLYLDIHEKYHGPHGLVAGTTGSGKSETLQSYILSLAVNYHPHEVGFILIDYKGGGMAQSFVGLPHLCGVITNLGGNATNRALLSINAEIKSRQRIFNNYKVKHIDAYIELYRSGVATEPMPHLLIIADEFAELKKEQPEFVRALVSAARVGRSLGINLILATQKPSGVVDDEIWSNTRFRLCLRVADKQDSNEMLKRPDAAFITGTGRGYFQVGSDEIFEEFQSGWSGAEYEPHIPFNDEKNAKVELINLIGKSGVPKKKKKKKSDNIAKLTQLDAVVKYAEQLAKESQIAPLKQIWMPPLPRAVYLDELEALKKPEGFSLLLPVGLVDNPQGQNQYPCTVDFLTDGHLLVCGASGSGKTTLLQTLVYGAANRYTPEEVNLYIADFSSRTMAVFSALPHVGGVMFEGDDAAIAETFEMLQKNLAQRKSEFSAQGIGSFREYVAQHSDCPAIVLMIDNYTAFIESYDHYEDALGQLSREAASYGIYLVITAGNSGELRSRIRQNFTAGIALQMPDKFEYEAVIGDRTEIIPEGRTPGRGLIKAPHPVEFQTALCVRQDEGLSQVQTLRRRFAAMKPAQSQGAKRIGAKLDRLGYGELIGRADIRALGENLLALGLEAEEGTPVTIDLNQEFLYTVGGAGGSGKTNLLAAVAQQAKAKKARVYLFDSPDGTLEQRGGFDGVAHNAAELFALMDGTIVQEFTQRNGVVANARDEGTDIVQAMARYDRIVLIINDISAFISAVYSQQMDMSGFIEVAFEKGFGHKIHFFAAVTPDDWADMARYAAMRTFAAGRRGVHLGGMFDQQGILQFSMSAADTVRQLPPGTGVASDGRGGALRVITPLVQEEG